MNRIICIVLGLIIEVGLLMIVPLVFIFSMPNVPLIAAEVIYILWYDFGGNAGWSVRWLMEEEKEK